MRTIKYAAVIIFSITSISIFAQLNPVKNLYYIQSYDYGNNNCPAYNCFTLSWSMPDISTTDTLIKYNIYQNNILWESTNQTQLACSGFYPCNYNNIYDALPFWFSVKAVYNSDFSESIADDSIYVYDLAINIETEKNNKNILINNPIKSGENISIILPDIETNNLIVTINTENGQFLKQYHFQNRNNEVITFSSSFLCKGVYILNVQYGPNWLSQKLIIE